MELRTVDESAEREARVVRLQRDGVKEVEDFPVTRVGGDELPEKRLETASKEEMKTRSIEPGVGSLIEAGDLVDTSPDGEWTEAQQRGGWPWGWLALIGVAFAAGILWSLYQVNTSSVKQADLTEGTRDILERERQEELAALRTIETMERVVRNFHDSRTVEELARYVRHPERVTPLMEKYYGERLLRPSRVLSIESMDPLTIENRANFWMFSVTTDPVKPRDLLIEMTSGGEAKVDWETYVCDQPMDWDSFALDRPEGAVGDFRVYVEKDHFYSHEFVDSEKWASYRLTALRGGETLFGYVERRRSLGKRINALIEENGGRPTPMILELELPEGLESKRGVLIRSLASPRWLYVEDPKG